MFFRKRDRDPTPPWLMWLFLGFVAFAVFSHERKGTPTHPNEFRKTVDQAAKNLNPSNFVDFSVYKDKIFPSYVATLRIKDVRLGRGLPAVCGQEATVTYENFFTDGRPVDETGEKKLTFTIGAHAVMPVFEQGVIGMQPDGVRSLLAPPTMAYGIPQFRRDDVPPTAAVRFDVKLLSVAPPLPDPDASPYRIAEVSQGGGDAILCGDPVTAQVTVWDTEGKKFYSTRDNGGKPITFTPGKSEVFLGLEQGVIGMSRGGMRTIIVPPSFQKPMRGDMPAITIPLPESQTVLVDVEAQ